MNKNEMMVFIKNLKDDELTEFFDLLKNEKKILRLCYYTVEGIVEHIEDGLDDCDEKDRESVMLGLKNLDFEGILKYTGCKSIDELEDRLSVYDDKGEYYSFLECIKFDEVRFIQDYKRENVRERKLNGLLG